MPLTRYRYTYRQKHWIRLDGVGDTNSRAMFLGTQGFDRVREIKWLTAHNQLTSDMEEVVSFAHYIPKIMQGYIHLTERYTLSDLETSTHDV